MAAEDDFFVIRLGAKRDIKRARRDFSEEELENWPSILVAFNNDPNIQKTAIQIAHNVFYRTTTVARILENSINKQLAKYQLSVHFSATFSKNQFWEEVAKHENKIIQVEFDMISPNLASISRALNFDLSEINRRTNSHETKLQLSSGGESSLKLSKDDTFIESLVDYSSEGGGNITLKVKGINRRIMTENTITEVSMDNFEATNLSPKQIVGILKGFLK